MELTDTVEWAKLVISLDAVLNGPWDAALIRYKLLKIIDNHPRLKFPQSDSTMMTPTSTPAHSHDDHFSSNVMFNVTDSSLRTPASKKSRLNSVPATPIKSVSKQLQFTSSPTPKPRETHPMAMIKFDETTKDISVAYDEFEDGWNDDTAVFGDETKQPLTPDQRREIANDLFQPTDDEEADNFNTVSSVETDPSSQNHQLQSTMLSETAVPKKNSNLTKFIEKVTSYINNPALRASLVDQYAEHHSQQIPPPDQLVPSIIKLHREIPSLTSHQGNAAMLLFQLVRYFTALQRRLDGYNAAMQQVRQALFDDDTTDRDVEKEWRSFPKNLKRGRALDSLVSRIGALILYLPKFPWSNLFLLSNSELQTAICALSRQDIIEYYHPSS